MKRDEVASAAAAIARIEALKEALASVERAPMRSQVPLYLFRDGGCTSVRVHYSREIYLAIVRGLIEDEERWLGDLGVEP